MPTGSIDPLMVQSPERALTAHRFRKNSAALQNDRAVSRGASAEARIDMKTHFDRITNVCCAAALSLSTVGCFGTQEETVLAREPPPRVVDRERPAAGSSVPPKLFVDGAIDLLFVIDDTQKSRAEKEYLRAKVPEVLRAFTNPKLADGNDNYSRDLHVGIVSSDMGVAGTVTSWPGCSPHGGRDGWLQSTGDAAPGCNASYPPYLSYRPGDNPDQLLADFACVSASLGDGCGVAQPLEASLKALWPGHRDNVPPEQSLITFLSTSESGRYGHGDDAPNYGFLRNATATGPSTLVIVVITNNEDCSLRDATGFGTSGDPDRDESAVIKCYQNKENLFDLVRYERAFQQLRPNAPDSVIFAGIVGVPPSSVSATARAEVDWSDEASRDAYYAGIEEQLEDRIVDASKPSGSGLAPSCVGGGVLPASGTSPGGSSYVEAYPPHRILELARRFGEDGFVRSICDDDFSTLADRVVQRIQRRRN